eukprot:11252418-Heterocapsa_arctica.AAC.1
MFLGGLPPPTFSCFAARCPAVLAVWLRHFLTIWAPAPCSNRPNTLCQPVAGHRNPLGKT